MSSVNGVTSSSNGGVSVSGAGGGPGGSTTRALVTPPSTSESPELSMVLEKAQVLLTKVEHFSSMLCKKLFEKSASSSEPSNTLLLKMHQKSMSSKILHEMK